MTNTLILVEGDEDVEILKKSMNDSKDTKIIAFDFLAHKSLKELEIPHSIIDAKRNRAVSHRLKLLIIW